MIVGNQKKKKKKETFRRYCSTVLYFLVETEDELH